ncbi:MAG: SDR family NAD(P)-dependent oxidoreductase [Candidatus Thorarchaeota archaeon]|jgi:NAD(P)-dependent dehydrogenase (short-subunit alcohol dehydrogenase family)
MKRLDGKVVLITGVAAGIGRATANLFAKEGARIVGADIDEAGGTSITTKVQAFGGNMTFVKTDMSYEPDIKALFEVARNLGGVDVLFNNAGIETAKGILETTEEDWDQCVNVNLKSV